MGFNPRDWPALETLNKEVKLQAFSQLPGKIVIHFALPINTPFWVQAIIHVPKWMKSAMLTLLGYLILKKPERPA